VVAGVVIAANLAPSTACTSDLHGVNARRTAVVTDPAAARRSRSEMSSATFGRLQV
jgi:hypothetical protein